MCYSQMLAQLDVEAGCAGLDFGNSDCDRIMEKCFDREFRIEMRDFFLEKAIQFKQWIILARNLLDDSHAQSVFYFFSPFLVHFCSVCELVPHVL